LFFFEKSDVKKAREETRGKRKRTGKGEKVKEESPVSILRQQKHSAEQHQKQADFSFRFWVPRSQAATTKRNAKLQRSSVFAYFLVLEVSS
jgi:hypothetical protein